MGKKGGKKVKIHIFHTPALGRQLCSMQRSFSPLPPPPPPRFYSLANEAKHRNELPGCRVPVFKGFQPKTVCGFNGTTHPAAQSVCLWNRGKKKTTKKAIILIKTVKKCKSENAKKWFRLGEKRTYVFLLRAWLPRGKSQQDYLPVSPIPSPN